jgi:hypothetical protein
MLSREQLRQIRRLASTIAFTGSDDLVERCASEIAAIVAETKAGIHKVSHETSGSGVDIKVNMPSPAMPARIGRKHRGGLRRTFIVPDKALQHDPEVVFGKGIGDGRTPQTVRRAQPAEWDSWRINGFRDDPRAVARELRWAGLPPATRVCGHSSEEAE